MKCCLCGGEIEVERNALGEAVWDKGHNPDPLASVEEHCCGVCNDTKVIPARLKAALDSVRKT